jgi:hypothetical protein
MRKTGSLILSLFLLLSVFVWDSLGAAKGGSVSVRGYVRKDGTYVAPHYRSAPDGNFYNNWSTKGNVNPYTGEAGTRVTPPGQSSGSGSVGGYIRQDGTYVAPFLPSTREGEWSSIREQSGTSKSYTGETSTKEAERMIERKAYWRDRGFDVDKVNAYSSYDLDMKLRAEEKAKATSKN